jgi:hypothetical protein
VRKTTLAAEGSHAAFSATTPAAAGVDFLIVGAHALAAHGVPRATGALDIWVRPTPDNAARTLKALAEFGAPLVRPHCR